MNASPKMSLVGAILMNVNLMVGASAFMAPGYMTQYAGTASFYGWLFAGALFFPVVWCIAHITEYFPGQGSFYSYSSNTISRTAGFLSGWMYFLGYVSIGSLQLMSLTSIITRSCNASFFTAFPVVSGIALVIILGALSLRSIGLIDRIQSMATLYKLTPLLIGIISLLYYFSPAKTPSIFATSPLVLVPTIPMAIFGFWGFEGICSISHLIKDSKKNTRRAIFIGFICTILIYTLFHLSLLAIMGAEALKTQGAINFVEYLSIASPWLLRVLSIVIMSAIIVAHINAIFGGIVANSAMLCTMAEDRLLFAAPFFAHRLPATGRPLGAIIAHCVGIIFCITCVASSNVLNAMANLGILISFIFTICALIIRTQRDTISYTKKATSLLVSLLGLASCGVLSYYSWQIIGVDHGARIISALPLIGALVLGYGMYMITAYKKKSR
jgi:amino acid transporter